MGGVGEGGAQLERLGALRPEEEPCDHPGGTFQAEGGQPSGSRWGRARPSRPVGGAEGTEGEAAERREHRCC